MRPSEIIILASTNRHKFEEFTLLLKKFPHYKLVPVQEYIRNADKLGLVETSDHYYDNALAKARAANHGCHYPCLSDDSGLEVDALNGKPGAKSHRFAIAKAGQTQDAANNQKLLEELKSVPTEKRTARFLCHLALVMEGTLLHTVGTLEGTIATSARGNDGFGYDPLFIPHGHTKTLAELGQEAKNKISHRARAIEGMIEELQKRAIVLAKP